MVALTTLCREARLKPTFVPTALHRMHLSVNLGLLLSTPTVLVYRSCYAFVTTCALASANALAASCSLHARFTALVSTEPPANLAQVAEKSASVARSADRVSFVFERMERLPAPWRAHSVHAVVAALCTFDRVDYNCLRSSPNRCLS